MKRKVMINQYLSDGVVKDEFICSKDLYLIDCGDGEGVYVCADGLDEVEEFLERFREHICR